MTTIALKVYYRQGYKYQLARTLRTQTSFRPEEDISTEWIGLSREGVLTIREGYASDGPSGPTIDTKNFMRGAFVHDALYQLLREGHLPQSAREICDRELNAVLREDGMSAVRRWVVYNGLRLGGANAAKYDLAYNPEIEAP